jgi:hypothetical protein
MTQMGTVAEEAGAVEVDVGEVERHRPTLGDLTGFTEGCSDQPVIAADEVIHHGREQASGKLIRPSRAAEAVSHPRKVMRADGDPRPDSRSEPRSERA